MVVLEHAGKGYVASGHDEAEGVPQILQMACSCPASLLAWNSGLPMYSSAKMQLQCAVRFVRGETLHCDPLLACLVVCVCVGKGVPS